MWQMCKKFVIHSENVSIKNITIYIQLFANGLAGTNEIERNMKWLIVWQIWTCLALLHNQIFLLSNILLRTIKCYFRRYLVLVFMAAFV